LPAVPFGDEPRTQAQNVPLSAAANIPSMPAAAASPAAPAAAREHRAAVQLDVEALRARAKRPERIAALDGAAEPRARVIRKTRENALQRPVRG
jgi:uncharacterized metal-binding protein